MVKVVRICFLITGVNLVAAIMHDLPYKRESCLIPTAIICGECTLLVPDLQGQLYLRFYAPAVF
jgi:hypothetical protein